MLTVIRSLNKDFIVKHVTLLRLKHNVILTI